MATSYEAVVRFLARDIPREQEVEVARRLRQALPAPATVELVRERDDGDVLADVRLMIVANDSSEVQIEARRLCQEAVREAGLGRHVAEVEDIDVRASS